MSPRAWSWVALAIAAALPAFFYPVLLMKVLCFALFASAFNLLLGFAGLVSFGHAAFFAIAGYFCAYLARTHAVDPLLAIAAGTAMAAALGGAMGWLAIRRAGIYFSMITLALAQLVYFYLLQAPWTGAEDGLQGIPRGKLLGLIDLDDNRTMYYFVLSVCAGGLWLVYRTIHSPFGQVLAAIRDNEPRALSIGYDVARFKLLAFVLSAGLSGLAGALKVLSLQLASLADAHWHMSGEVILMVTLGGMGTVVGPVMGAAFVSALQHYLAGAGSWVTALMGLIFMVVVLLFRQGLAGELQALRKRWRNSRPASAATTLTKKEI